MQVKKTLIEQMNEDYSGIICIHKPGGVSSFAVTRAFRNEFSIKKVGHAGTLDPLAEGLLILGFGQGTKVLSSLQGLKKTYKADFFLGSESSTEDAEGEIARQTAQASGIVRSLSYRSLEKAAKRFEGQISQVPSRFSAVHFKGRRAYELAREGKSFELEPRKIEIYSFRVGKIKHLSRLQRKMLLKRGWRGEARLLECEICCSKGTYIRALARDFGRELGCGGYSFRLQRTKIGPFSLSDCAECRFEEGRLCINRAQSEAKAISVPSLWKRLEEK